MASAIISTSFRDVGDGLPRLALALDEFVWQIVDQAAIGEPTKVLTKFTDFTNCR